MINIGENLEHLGFGDDFLDTTPKAFKEHQQHFHEAKNWTLLKLNLQMKTLKTSDLSKTLLRK